MKRTGKPSLWNQWWSVLLARCLGWFALSTLLSANQLAGPDISVRKIHLHNKTFELHLSQPIEEVPTPQPIFVLYASGDGGWYGAAVDMFKDIVRSGYPAAGFSSRSYMKDLSFGEAPITDDDLVSDYSVLLNEARAGLHLSVDCRVILSGWSRGAAFATLAGSDDRIRSAVAGIVAIGLPPKEELNIRIRGRKIFLGNLGRAREHLLFDTYDRIPALAPLPYALIQSTHDDYLPAVGARSLFGLDSAVKRFYSVTARNHRFSGGKQEFAADLRDALAWICGYSNTSPNGCQTVIPTGQ